MPEFPRRPRAPTAPALSPPLLAISSWVTLLLSGRLAAVPVRGGRRGGVGGGLRLSGDSAAVSPRWGNGGRPTEASPCAARCLGGGVKVEGSFKAGAGRGASSVAVPRLTRPV